MPAIVGWFMGGLLSIVGSLTGRVLVALGIGVVTFSGLNVTLDFAVSYMTRQFGGLRVEIVQLAAALGVGEFLSIIVSALQARMLLNGLGPDGVIRKWVKK